MDMAVKDKDHIYGLVRGSAVNHGGKATSPTAPNPIAQQKLLSAAYTQAGIDPRTVSYIEAHGTGTELGDPIEFNGLKGAFTELYRKQGIPLSKRPHCGLGSVKTNIGHLEAAAGISGVLKILLMLKYRRIPGNVHLKEQNPYLQLEGSPFYLVKDTQEWDAIVGSNQKPIPRRAGVSSFGIGGANAHIIIEEWPSPTEGADRRDEGRGKEEDAKHPALIVLSAKNEDRLKEVAKNFYAYLTSPLAPHPLPLHEVAYTLQVGREAMEERLGLIVESVENLVEKLNRFLEDQDDVEDLYRGEGKRSNETLAVFAADEDLQKAMDSWISKDKYSKLLDLWVKGLAFDWNKIYGDSKPQRISLPTYPFARERYWISNSTRENQNHKSLRLHPLVHRNTSDFEEQRFSSTFTGEEFFLSDHVVKGKKVLPGVAYLEMARAAVEEASGSAEQIQTSILFKNVVWARPIAVNSHAKEVHVGLFPEENGQIQYEIYTDNANEQEDVDVAHDRNRKVHSQGVATYGSSDKIPALDLKSLQDSYNQSRLSAEQCYEAYKAMGIDYGPSHQGIRGVYWEEGQVLARLALPSCVANTQDKFVLHPSLMDSALQASVWLTPNVSECKPTLPFVLEELEVCRPYASSMWVWARFKDGFSQKITFKNSIWICATSRETFAFG